MERLAFCYERHEEIYSDDYHPAVMHVLLTFKKCQLVLLFQTL